MQTNYCGFLCLSKDCVFESMLSVIFLFHKVAILKKKKKEKKKKVGQLVQLVQNVSVKCRGTERTHITAFNPAWPKITFHFFVRREMGCRPKSIKKTNQVDLWHKITEYDFNQDSNTSCFRLQYQ